MLKRITILVLVFLATCLSAQARWRNVRGQIFFQDGDPVSFGTPGGPANLASPKLLPTSVFQRPARWVKVLVVQEGGYSAAGAGFTNDDGTFEVVADVPDNSVLQIFLQIDNAAARVFKDTDHGGEIFTHLLTRINSEAGGDIVIPAPQVIHADYSTEHLHTREGLTLDDTVAVSFAAAININDVILTIRDDIINNHDPSEGDTIDQADVEYCDESGNHFSWVQTVVLNCGAFNGVVPDSNGDGLDSGFVDGSIAHEYTHHLQYEIGAWDCCGGSHSPCLEINTATDDPELAWSEGFANYIAFHTLFNADGTLKPNMSSARRPFPSVDNQCDDGTGHITLTETSGGQGERWVSVDSSISGTLWDLNDGLGTGIDAWDRVDGVATNTHQTIIQIFDNELDPAGGPWNLFADAPDIHDFYRAWVGRKGETDEVSGGPALDAILNRFGIFPGGDVNPGSVESQLSGPFRPLQKKAPNPLVEANPSLPKVRRTVAGSPTPQYHAVYDAGSIVPLTVTRDFSFLGSLPSPSPNPSPAPSPNPSPDHFDVNIGVSNLGNLTMFVDGPSSRQQANSATYSATSSASWLSVTHPDGSVAQGSFIPQGLTTLRIAFLPSAFNLLPNSDGSPHQYIADVDVRFNVASEDRPRVEKRTIRVVFNFIDGPDSDTDHDGLRNREELALQPRMPTPKGVPCPNPKDWDSDGDSIWDGDEQRLWHTNPCLSDTDGDGIDDQDEIWCTRGSPRDTYIGRCECFNPLVRDTAAAPGSDPDHDGLTNREEGERGTHRCKADTDDDCVNDSIDNCPTTFNPRPEMRRPPPDPGRPPPERCEPAPGPRGPQDPPPGPREPQADLDHDGIGDACDFDADGDGCERDLDGNDLDPSDRQRAGMCAYPNRGIRARMFIAEDLRIMHFLDGGRADRFGRCGGLPCPAPGLVTTDKNFEVLRKTPAAQFGIDEKSGFGIAAQLIPDLNGDSVAELAIGAPFAKNREGLAGAGVVLIISGETGKLLGRLEGTVRDEGFGATLASMGKNQIAIGAPGSKQTPGAAYIARLSDFKVTRKLSAKETGDEFGGAIASVGDFDQDGAGDLLIGAPNANGALPAAGVVYLALSSGSLRRIGEGEQTGGRFGNALLFAGDSSHDGVPEVLVGAPLATKLVKSVEGKTVEVNQTGEVTLLSLSGRRLWARTGSFANERFGTSLAVAATNQTDGSATEFIIGAPGAEFNGKKNAGRAYHLRAAGTMRGFITGETANEELGSVVVGTANLDGGAGAVVLIEPNTRTGETVGRSLFYLLKTKR